MSEYLMAMTYDECPVENVWEEMNDYILDESIELNSQLKTIAKADVAPVVRVFKINDKQSTFIKEIRYEEYQCNYEKWA
ncbi:hypothetical protein J2R98_000057 [Alkalibacillus filiformis]|uniref:Uncharacterized protein n=1 Tax=Alkalibacillus filiformis TaxID=200990 RepID=A0ABU0DP86_9BACI|nr:hypothetical protein [Alkalibacillus filiformis]MDQ0350254.1 hypothetical protein [Alkalibacillus filiformis]